MKTKHTGTLCLVGTVMGNQTSPFSVINKWKSYINFGTRTSLILKMYCKQVSKKEFWSGRIDKSVISQMARSIFFLNSIIGRSIFKDDKRKTTGKKDQTGLQPYSKLLGIWRHLWKMKS